MTDSLKVGLIQQCCGDDINSNLNACIASIKLAADQGAKLVLLQELHNSKYFCQTENTDNFSIAETIPGPTTDRLTKLARSLGIVIVASLFEKRAEGLYHNTAVVLDSDGSIAGKYQKMHIPDDPGYYEKFYFTPGDIGFKPIQTSLGSLGVLICWDQWFPEAARLMCLAGAEILLYPTAIGWDKLDSDEEKTRQQQAWQTIQRSHAIANNVPVLCCNRTGHESPESDLNNGIDFWGNSFICGQQGEILSEAPYNKECILVTDIVLDRTKELRVIWPFLRDRRIDYYADLTERYLDND